MCVLDGGVISGVQRAQREDAREVRPEMKMGKAL
jgi:hypothetical protein